MYLTSGRKLFKRFLTLDKAEIGEGVQPKHSNYPMTKPDDNDNPVLTLQELLF